MAKVKRLSRVARDCNVGIQTIVEFLGKKGIDIENNPNSKIAEEALALVMEAFQQDQSAKREAERFTQEHRQESSTAISINEAKAEAESEANTDESEQVEEVLLIQDSGESATIVEPAEVIAPKPVEKPKEEPPASATEGSTNEANKESGAPSQPPTPPQPPQA